MSALDPIDLASLMEQEPRDCESEGNPFEFEEEGARGAGKPLCGVCLFPLDPSAKTSNVDLDDDLSLIESTSASSKRCEFQVSAARGCTYCKKILNFALDHGAVQLELKHKSDWRGIGIDRENGTSENFLFLAPLNTTHEDLNNQGHNFVCRGHGAASMKGTSEDEVLEEARLWLDRCIQEHKCRPQLCSYIPHRLLRVKHSADEAATVLWLVENITTLVEYVALSHRWCDETKAVSLVHSNRPQRIEKGVLACDLPRLMQDTIHVLRQFQIEYLWIDCMCIIQDDNADWKREAVCMASIYKNATFTISAIHCQSSSESLFSQPNRITPAGFMGELPGGIPVHLEQHIPHPFRYVGSSDSRVSEYLNNAMGSRLNLLSRGWVYQEVLLSPRNLFFLANEIMWRCRECTICQCARYDFDETCDESVSSKALTDSTGTLYYSERGCQQICSRDWANIVQVYSSKDLTYPQDRLPALAGIAEEYSDATGWTYICGLWWQDIERTFVWSRAYTKARRPDTGLPSWSWASIATEVVMGGTRALDVEFESFHVTYNNRRNPYLGDVEHAVLNLRGDVFPAKLVPPSSFGQYKDITLPGLHGEWGVSMLSTFIAGLLEDYELTETSISTNADVVCLILHIYGDGYGDGHFDCLVLRSLDNHASHYERLGRVWIDGIELHSDWRTQWNVSKRRLALM